MRYTNDARWVVLVLQVTFQGGSLQEFADLYLPDISGSGIFIRTDQPLAVGTRLRFVFANAAGGRLLEGQAIVVWVTEESGNPQLPRGMELRFEALPMESERVFDWLQLYKRGATVAPPGAPGPHRTGAGQRKTPRPTLVKVPKTPRPTLVKVPADRAPDNGRRNSAPYVRSQVDEVPEPGSGSTHRAGQPAERAPPGQGTGSDTDPMFYRTASSQSESLARRGPRRWPLLVSAMVLAAMVLMSSLLYRATRAPAATATSVRLLRLASSPAGAEVVVDGVPAGRTPLEVPVEARSRVQLRAAHFDAQDVDLSRVSGWQTEGHVKVLSLRIPLHRAGPPTTAAPVVTPPGAEPKLARPKPKENRRAPARTRSRAPAATQPSSQPATAASRAAAPDRVDTAEDALPP